MSLPAFLSGCVLPALLRPPPPALGQDAVIPPDLTFTMADGTILPARTWLPPAGTPWRGVMLGLHGFGDSRDGWELSAPVFARAGYAFYAPDQRGFGATSTRGHWAGTAHLVADAAALVTALKARHPGLPVILLGESMGGAVALILAAQPNPPQESTILLAPAVWGWDQLPVTLQAALVTADAIAPGWSPDPNQAPVDILASDNFPALIRLARDPLTTQRFPVSMLRGLVDLMQDAENAAPHLHGRVLILSGRRDQLVPPEATASAWRSLPPSVRRGFYPEGYHLLLRDRDRALVQADILSWLAEPGAPLPSGADIAAAAWVADHAWEGMTPAWAPDFYPGKSGWPY